MKSRTKVYLGRTAIIVGILLFCIWFGNLLSDGEDAMQIRDALYSEVFKWGDEFPQIYKSADLMMNDDNEISNKEFQALGKEYKALRIKKGATNE